MQRQGAHRRRRRSAVVSVAPKDPPRQEAATASARGDGPLYKAKGARVTARVADACRDGRKIIFTDEYNVDVCLPEEAFYSCQARNLRNAAVDALCSVLAMSAIPKQAKGIVAMSVTYLQHGVKRPVWKSYCNHMCVAMDPKGGMLTKERAIELGLSGTT